MRLEDMRLFAAVAQAKGFTEAAKRLGVPKQTLSRRVAELERELGVQLLLRTTRRLKLTEPGAAYAARCEEVVRLAEEANRAVRDERQKPSGTLRITADPTFGEAFVTPLVIEYARRFPEVRIDVMLTRRKVDLVEEGFDCGFRVGTVEDPALTIRSLGPARVRYCASPSYVKKRGRPAKPEELAKHDCIVLATDASPVRWPVKGLKGPAFVAVEGRLRLSSFEMAQAAARAGLGIAIFPEFACAEDVRRGRLVTVLDDSALDVGAVWLVYPTSRLLPARLRAFIDLAVERLGRTKPWSAPASAKRR